MTPAQVTTEPRQDVRGSPARTMTRIVAGVDGFPEGRDAAALAHLLAQGTGADLMLVAVYSAPLVPAPPDLNYASMRRHSLRALRDVRDDLAPGARTKTATDQSVARSLHRVVQRHHSDLLVMGSSRAGPKGRVRIGKRTRQLLCHFDCALALRRAASASIHPGGCTASPSATTAGLSQAPRSPSPLQSPSEPGPSSRSTRSWTTGSPVCTCRVSPTWSAQAGMRSSTAKSIRSASRRWRQRGPRGRRSRSRSRGVARPTRCWRWLRQSICS